MPCVTACFYWKCWCSDILQQCSNVTGSTSDASGCDDATMPRVPITGDRREVKSISCTLAWASAGVFAAVPGASDTRPSPLTCVL